MRGVFIGHTWSHTKTHFYRSILESIAYDHYFTREVIRSVRPEIVFGKVAAIGSGAQSAMWSQIKADVLQQTFQSYYRTDLSTLGSAMIGGVAIGLFSDFDGTLKKILKIRNSVPPRPGEYEKYKKYVEAYIRMLTELKGIFTLLGS